MKKVIALLLALAMCLSLLAGCGKKDKEPDDGKIEDMPNPVVTYADIQEQTDAMGIGLEAPEGASDVVYQSINKMVETLFTYDGVQYFYRAEPTDKTEAYDISGLMYDWSETVSTTVSDREAEVKLNEEVGFIMWLDAAPGINYNLGTASKTSADQLTAVAAMAFVPVQSEAEDDDPEVVIGLSWDMVEFGTCEEQAEAAGFGLKAPEGATDVIYQLISGTLVQTKFTLDGVEYFYRGQATGSTQPFDISGLNYKWTGMAKAKVGGNDAVVRTSGEAGFIMWLDIVPGINYNLGTSSAVKADQLAKLAKEIFVPVQNEEPGEIIGMKNPIKTFASLEEQETCTGIGLKAPDGAENVYYQAIGGMAQTLFTLDGTEYFYRAEPCSCPKEYDMSGLNYDWQKTVQDKLNDIPTVAMTCSKAGFIMWLDASTGINYNLGTSNKISADSLLKLAKTVFVGEDPKYIGGMANPMAEAESADAQKAITGIGLEAPKNAENVVYLTIKGGMSETRFTLDGTEYRYRAMATKSPVSFDISGMFYDWTKESKGEVKGLKAQVSTCAEAGFVMWLDKEYGIDYCLAVIGATDAEKLLEAANIAYKPVGGKEDPEEDEPESNMKNPVVTFESFEEQQAAFGFGLQAPSGAENVEYHGIKNMAETKFTLNGVVYFYRAEPTSFVEAVDISGLNYEWTGSAEGTVKDKAAKVSFCDEAGFVMWLDVVTGINYNLGTAAAVDADALIALAEEVFQPLQIDGMKNPVISYDSAEEQFKALGFSLPVPDPTWDAQYQSINGMAETVFIYEGVEYFYRAEPTAVTECYNMSGIFKDEWDEPVLCKVRERDGQLLTAGNAAVLMWSDPVTGFNYNLSCVNAVDTESLLALAELIYVPLQGETAEEAE